MLPFVKGETAAVHGDDFTMGWELFDLAQDPLESRDLGAAEPERLALLIRAWDA